MKTNDCVIAMHSLGDSKASFQSHLLVYSKILKLCKRLNKITIDDILPILQATQNEICPVLDELVTEGRLELRKDGTYFYKEVENKKLICHCFLNLELKKKLI